jgi:O-antigen biosynthesis protein WbqV
VNVRSLTVYGHDLVMTGIALVVAYNLRVTGEFWTAHAPTTLTIGLPLLILLAAPVYWFGGLYRGVWRYASLPDLVRLLRAVTVLCIVFTIGMFLATRLEGMPRSLPFILWFVLVALLGGPRFAYRLYRDHRTAHAEAARLQGGAAPILLAGAKDEADIFIRQLARDKTPPYRAVGIVDLKRGRVGREIRGVKILGSVDALPEIVHALERAGNRPQRIVLTVPPGEIGGPAVRRLLDQADQLGLSLSRLPPPTELRDAGDNTPVEVRPIAVEDLLGRPQASLDRTAIADLIRGRRVLVTGAGGTIGGELARQVAALGPSELAVLDVGEYALYAIDLELAESFPDLARRSVLCDVRDRARVAERMAAIRPDVVFHAAALKHVPIVEAHPAEGALTNVVGTRNVADAARACGARAMVLISTDKAVRPTNVMGATKRVAEAYCQSLDLSIQQAGGTGTRFMTVRFGNVLGSSGSVVPLFQRQLQRGGPLTVTHPEVRRYFMTVREAVELVLQASAHGLDREAARGRVFVLDMGEPVRIADLARQMIRLAGLRPETDVKIVFTGLRPGEKLYEEILTDAEGATRTDAEGVFIASPHVADHAIVARAVAELERAAQSDDEEKLLAILRNMVPDYERRAAG